MTLNEANTFRIYAATTLIEAGQVTLPYSLNEQYNYIDNRVGYKVKQS